MIPVKDHFPDRKTTPVYFPYVVYPEYIAYQAGDRAFVTCIPEGLEKSDIHNLGQVFYNNDYSDNVHSYCDFRSQFKEICGYDMLISYINIGMRKFEIEKAWQPVYYDNHDIRSFMYDDEASELLVESFKRYGAFYKEGWVFFESRCKQERRFVGHLVSVFVEDVFFLLNGYKSWCFLAGERGFDTDYLNRIIMQTNTYTKTECIKTLDEACKKTITSLARKAAGTIKYQYHMDELCPAIYLNNMIDALSYQLLSIISLGDESMEGVIAICKECKQQYIKKHGSATLCPVCRTPREKSRNFRMKRKRDREDGIL